MNRVLSYYKKYILYILLMIVVLIVQVKFELLLPKYTSNIVNIGIQQDGLTDSIPKVMDETTYAMVLSLSEEKEKSSIAKSYVLWQPKSNDSKNNKIKLENSNVKMIPDDRLNTNYYVLKNEINTDTLGKFMSNSLVNYAKYISSRVESSQKTSYPTIENVKSLPDFMKKQISIKIVKSIYKRIGIDVDKIQKDYLWKTGLLMVILSLVTGGLSIAVSYLSSRVSASVSRDLRKDSYKKVLTFSNNELNKFSIASLISRGTNDIQQVQQSSVMLLKFMFYGPIMAVGALYNVFKLDVSMVWIIALSVAVTITAIIIIMSRALPKFRYIQTLVDKLNLVTREFISGIEVNRVFGTQKFEEKRFDDVNSDLTKSNLFMNRLMSILQPAMMFIMNGTTLLIIWIGSKQIDSGNIQVGDMMAFIEYSMQIIMAFLFISMVSVILPRAMISANRIGEVLNTEISIKDDGELTRVHNLGTVEFRDVSFKYDGAVKSVLDNISFSIDKGQTLGIIGSTGSGKSTIVNLIPRFLEASSGEIFINGENIKDISLKTLRNIVSIVPQKPVIFSGTIASNIEYAQSVRNNKRLMIASDIAQCDEFVNEKNDGLESLVSQDGSNLSGGQKQRVSIARAIDRDSEILVFDDSFSALDANTDRKLRKSLKKNLYDKTVIIVAQRINTIIDADKIIVLDDGKIVGQGKHEDLIKNCDIYYEIAKSQLSEEEIENGKQ
ncbi:ABC transporter ATP-binding protein [Peptostreptococcus anaerobius]|uniref:ABC transporter ATP-binding protein n=1 Tax=Peptostreptococcus porci TaxID=2652282 RepID=A0A6N7WYN5_9FIRM|nr:ABC transporter ATP-binding protein [Peptostreptococcus porci]MST61908.1 ABC transporter ATP-binding protein [Peptostreptococcus porci]